MLLLLVKVPAVRTLFPKLALRNTEDNTVKTQISSLYPCLVDLQSSGEESRKKWGVSSDLSWRLDLSPVLWETLGTTGDVWTKELLLCSSWSLGPDREKEEKFKATISVPQSTVLAYGERSVFLAWYPNLASYKGSYTRQVVLSFNCKPDPSGAWKNLISSPYTLEILI